MTLSRIPQERIVDGDTSLTKGNELLVGIWGNVVEGIHVASSDPYIFHYVSLLNFEFRRLLQQSNHCLLINFENMDLIIVFP